MFNEDRINYLQIDFLRLFRLCKNMNIISRKRKMPIDYISDSKNFDKALVANKRLFTMFLKSLFNGYSISNEKYSYYISVPYSMVSDITYIEKLITRITSNNTTPRQIDILQRHLNLKDGIRGHICLIRGKSLEIRVSLSSVDASSPARNAILKGNTNRPSQDFYRCALACIDFKNIWERDMALINQFVIDHQKDLEEFKEEIIENKVEEVKPIINSSRLNSQLAFNNALLQYRSSSNESRED